MKKLLLAILLVVFLANPAYALFDFGGGTKDKVWVFESKNAAGDSATAAGCPYPGSLRRSVDVIVPGTYRVLGWTIIVTDSSGSKGAELCGLWDMVGGVDECLNESESTSMGGTVWFAYPLTITTKLILRQAMNTTVYIYYTK